MDNFDNIDIVDLNDLELTEEEIKERQEKEAAEEVQLRKQEFLKELKEWAVVFVVTFVVVFVLKNYVIVNAMVPTGSMENTIMPKDQLFGNRLAYSFAEPQRGDIIFFYYPDNEEEKFVKRIIGLPGETVTIEKGKVYINNSEIPLEEPYLKEEWVVANDGYRFQVPADSYFVMGDNRNDSKDSRFWKNPYVKEEKIIGEAFFIYAPFDRMGVLE